MQKQEKPKSILIKNPPENVWLKICEAKRKIIENNKSRSLVSHEEAIYKLILNNCS